MLMKRIEDGSEIPEDIDPAVLEGWAEAARAGACGL